MSARACESLGIPWTEFITYDKSFLLEVKSSWLPRAPHPRESKVCHMNLNVVEWQQAFLFNYFLMWGCLVECRCVGVCRGVGVPRRLGVCVLAGEHGGQCVSVCVRVWRCAWVSR